MTVPFVEKYRPTEFDDTVGIKDLDMFKNIVKTPKDFPSLLLYGAQGTGKTTIAKILINKLKPVDYIRINGSDTTGVDTIRELVYNFMSSRGISDDKPKIVWIEEFDFMSQASMAALRAMSEQFIKNARFICTANYIKKIPEPIQSRFTCVEFNKPTAEEVFPRLKYVCDNEGITVSDDVLRTIIKNNYGDIRAMINTIQRLSSNPMKMIEEYETNNELVDEVYNLLSNGKWSDIRYSVPLKNPDYNKLLVDLDSKFFESDLDISIKTKINEIIAQGLFEMVFSFDKNICFSAICSKMIKVMII